MRASIGGIVRNGEDRLDVTELELAQLDIWIVVYNMLQKIYLCALFWGGGGEFVFIHFFT